MAEMDDPELTERIAYPDVEQKVRRRIHRSPHLHKDASRRKCGLLSRLIWYPARRHGSHGFTTGTSVFVKSPTLRETIVKLWWIAVAASKASMADKGLPFIFATAAIKPQRSATAASIDRILPEKRACSSNSSHVSRRLRRLPCGSAAKPFRISPNVRTLK